jgi:hypothetical protein
MIRYGRATDAHDLDLIKTVFADDATAQYEPWTDLLANHDAVIDRWVEGLEPIATMHQFTNFAYEVDGDVGAYSCLVTAQHWHREADPLNGAPLYTNGGRYDVHVRRTPQGWRIAHLHFRAIWHSGDPRVLGHL